MHKQKYFCSWVKLFSQVIGLFYIVRPNWELCGAYSPAVNARACDTHWKGGDGQGEEVWSPQTVLKIQIGKLC